MAYKCKIYPIYKIDKKIDPILFRCSLRNCGYMWGHFLEYRDDKCAKIVICRKNKRIVGWGLRFKFKNGRNTKYSIMFYVRKTHRRKGLGTRIYKKLTYRLPKSKIEVYPDSSNKKFFNKVLTKKQSKV